MDTEEDDYIILDFDAIAGLLEREYSIVLKYRESKRTTRQALLKALNKGAIPHIHSMIYEDELDPTATMERITEAIEDYAS